ncbi:MAG: hypothetical protein ACP5M0_10640, partial [Desulfomonilaceae bacterium]
AFSKAVPFVILPENLRADPTGYFQVNNVVLPASTSFFQNTHQLDDADLIATGISTTGVVRSRLHEAR